VEIKNLKMNKKGGESVENIFMMVIMAVAISAGMYLFWVDAMGGADVSFPTEYNNSMHNLTTRGKDIETRTQDIRDTITELEDTSGIQTGWVALTGFGKVLLLLPATTVVAMATFMDLTTPFGALRGFIIAFISTAILIFIIFAVMRAIGGRREI